MSANDDESTYAGKYVQPTRGPLGRAYERVRSFVARDSDSDDDR